MRKYIFLAICILILLVGCKDFEANTTGKVQVVAIGLSYDETGASPLKGTINDVTEFGSAMLSIMNAKGIPRNVTFMLQEGEAEDRETYPSRDNVLKMLSSIELNYNDMLTVFYSGHGQNVWWAKCDICGNETYTIPTSCPTCDGKGTITIDKSVIPCTACNGTGFAQEMPETSCAYCKDSRDNFNLLTHYLTTSTHALKQTAIDYIDGVITKDEYISALKADGSPYANEILEVASYGERLIDNLSFKLRGFFVTAPENALSFQDFAKDYADRNTLFGAIAKRMQSDTALPNVNGYKTNAQGYYDALADRLDTYGCDRSDFRAFNRYWNIYQLKYWGQTSWTMLYMDELADLLETKGCRVLLIADGCYSGFAVDGRNESTQGFAEAFTKIFSSGSYRNLTVVSASTSSQVSLDSSVDTEDGYYEGHGLFTASLLEQLNWRHSRTSFSQIMIDGNVRKIYGYLSSTPSRLTMNEAMEKIRESWSYSKQAPQMNTTYLDTVLIP